MPSITEAKGMLRAEIARQPAVDYRPLLDEFLALPQVEEARTILLFYGVGREPDTRPLIHTLLDRGKTVALPRCLPGRLMEGRRVTDLEGLVPSSYGIPEPGEDCPAVERVTIDLILVPNLCCDRQGYRLGHGGGYYDRYLVGYRGRTVALCPAALLRDALPHDELDMPVELVLTGGYITGAEPMLRACCEGECR